MFEPYKQLLTIGITTYNDGKYLAKTIESCVNQAGRIVICDNASTDNTEEICRDFAKKYPNIDYFRLEQDNGKCFGFNFVIKEAKTKYFMWLGGHDYLDDNYTSPLIHMMENSDAVTCYPSSRSVTVNDEEIGLYNYWYSHKLTSDSACERIYTLISQLHEVGMFYGIHKTEILKEFLPHESFANMLGGDHVFLCSMAARGKMIYCPTAVFNWRQTKINLSDEDNTALQKNLIYKNSDQADSFDSSRRKMCELQLEVIKNCKTKNIFDSIRKLYLVRKAKKKLKKRFGF
ncbi:MAG: glycosyltransferase family 2 protein [Alphaproteobacteria bacterium]|nr:glycosyltransferase family 2 protein [Alphaproteobacteria bacterium]